MMVSVEAAKEGDAIPADCPDLLLWIGVERTIGDFVNDFATAGDVARPYLQSAQTMFSVKCIEDHALITFVET